MVTLGADLSNANLQGANLAETNFQGGYLVLVKMKNTFRIAPIINVIAFKNDYISTPNLDNLNNLKNINKASHRERIQALLENKEYKKVQIHENMEEAIQVHKRILCTDIAILKNILPGPGVFAHNSKVLRLSLNLTKKELKHLEEYNQWDQVRKKQLINHFKTSNKCKILYKENKKELDEYFSEQNIDIN